MNYEGKSIFTLAGDVVDPQTAINTLAIAANTVSIAANTTAIYADQEQFAEVYSQPMDAGTLTEQQWNGLPVGNHILWINGNGTAPATPVIGTLRAMGIATKPSQLSLLPTSGSGGGFVGISWAYDQTKTLSIELQAHTAISASGGAIVRAETWCRLMYYDSVGTLLGESSPYKQDHTTGTSTVEHVNNTRFEADFTFVPVGTTVVHVIPYINVDAPGTIQTSSIADTRLTSGNRLRATVRVRYP